MAEHALNLEETVLLVTVQTAIQVYTVKCSTHALTIHARTAQLAKPMATHTHVSAHSTTRESTVRYLLTNAHLIRVLTELPVPVT